MTDRRTNWLLRQFLDEEISADLGSGAVTVREAAERMRGRMVPLSVALKVVRIAAQ